MLRPERPIRSSFVLAWLVLASSAGCHGAIEGSSAAREPGTGGDADGGHPGHGGELPPQGDGGNGGGTPVADRPGVQPLHRLTKVEYANTVRDLLGLTGAVDQGDFVDDQIANHSGFAAGAPVDRGSDALQFLAAAEALVARAMPHVLDLVPCHPLPTTADAGDACMRTFIAQFGLRAYRRPLSDDEAGDLLALFQQQRDPARGALGFADATRVVITAMIQSPYFLYRWERGPAPKVEDGLVRFDGYELASRLSYLLWATMPDQTLFDAAASGALDTPAGVGAQARRLLADDRARQAIADFHLQWLDVVALLGFPKDPSFTAYTPALAQAMLDETAALAAHVYGRDGDGKLETLLGSPTGYVSGALASFYGVSGVTSAQPTAVALPPGRAGILGNASFLAAHATPVEGHPFRRGKAVLASVLCTELEPPEKPSEPIVLPERRPDQTEREHFAAASDRPCAAACHPTLNPIGFAFEHFDAVGAYRAMDTGKAVDASGTITLDGQSRSFDDAVGLGRLLGSADEARDCMARQWVRYLLRREEGGGEQPSLTAAQATWRASGYDLRELLVALTQTRAFTHRLPAPGELP